MRIAWTWRNAAYGAILAAPATALCVIDPQTGFAVAVGMLPAAALGVAATRKTRRAVVLVGLLAGVSMFLGSLFAPFPLIAVAAIAVLAIGVSLATTDPSRRVAPLALMLGLPLFGAGLSETSAIEGLTMAALMLGGSVYAWLVSLLWPEREPVVRPALPRPPRAFALQYGIQLALVGAVTAAVGFALGVDHPGWACTAALLVSRPDPRALHARGVQRSIAVLLGAALAAAIALAQPSSALLAVLVLVAIAVATATSGSRWYIMPFFSTLIVISMLIVGDGDRTVHWFVERLVLTVIGVVVALAAGWLVPAIGERVRRRTPRAGVSGS